MNLLKVDIEPAATIVIAAIGGWLFSLTGIPLGWLIGSMLSVVAMSLFKIPVHQPRRIMPFVRASVGTMLGASVTLGVLQSLTVWWPSFVFMVAVMLLGGFVNYQLLRRAFSFGKSESALCSVPGGIAEMILLSETTGGEQWRVAIVHAVRIALAILLIPILIGFIAETEIVRGGGPALPDMEWDDAFWFAVCIAAGLLSQKLKFIPARIVLVPMLVCGVLHVTGVTDFVVPTQLSNVVQIFIGINVGGRFVGVSTKLLMQVMLAAACVVMVQICFAFGSAIVGAGFLNADPITLALAYSPGGLAEMSLIAIAIGQEVAIIGFHHIARVLGALFTAPLILKSLTRRP